MFCTVLHQLKSPENVGMILRSHVAFGGEQVVFVGHDQPWRFTKSTQTYSRKLEKFCETLFLETDDDFFEWCTQNQYQPVAIEISEDAVDLREYTFPENTALILGNEAWGLRPEFLARCHAVVKIPQFGTAPCLNVAVSASLAMYELNRPNTAVKTVEGSKYLVQKATATNNNIGNNAE